LAVNCPPDLFIGMSFLGCALALMYAYYWHSRRVFSVERLAVLEGANTIPDGVLQ